MLLPTECCAGHALQCSRTLDPSALPGRPPWPPPCRTLFNLRRLDLRLRGVPHSNIAQALEQLPLLQCVQLSESVLAEPPRLPHLQRLDLWIRSAGEAQHLAAAIQHLTELTHLIVNDNFSNPETEAQLQLPGLQQLAQLRELHYSGPVPPQVWYCPQLTALTCYDNYLDQDDLPDADLQLGRLERLQLCNAAWTFPPQLCRLEQLTSLLWVDEDPTEDNMKTLPAQFSKLRWVGARGWVICAHLMCML